MQSIWLVIVVFFLVLFIMPIFISVHLSFDVFNNLGAISFYVYFIKFFALKLKFKNNEIIMYSENKKKEIELKVSEGQKRFLKQLTIQLKEKLIVRQCTAISRIGMENAKSTAILTGLFSSLIGIIWGKIKTTKRSANLNIINNPDYNGRHLSFCIYMKSFITLFDFIYATIMSFLITKRSEKYERV